jgi:hypothetical protein
MSKKLTETNPYLRNPTMRRKGLWISAKTSSAIEGIHRPFAREGSPAIDTKKPTKSPR